MFIASHCDRFCGLQSVGSFNVTALKQIVLQKKTNFRICNVSDLVDQINDLKISDLMLPIQTVFIQWAYNPHSFNIAKQFRDFWTLELSWSALTCHLPLSLLLNAMRILLTYSISLYVTFRLAGGQMKKVTTLKLLTLRDLWSRMLILKPWP